MSKFPLLGPVVVVSVKLGVKMSHWKAVKRDPENSCTLPMTGRNYFNLSVFVFVFEFVFDFVFEFVFEFVYDQSCVV